ncbi:MAG: L,D-transpeptidase, partial [Patescibacteria group bacterium]
ENNGEAWYVYPGDFHRYYLGTPDDAYQIMRNLSLGISNDNFSKIETDVPDRFRGLILLKPEDAGRAYYVSPVDKSLSYLASAESAFALMRGSSLGITSDDLKTIPVGKVMLDDTGKEISRQWQYLGWWGKINRNYVPVMFEPRVDSKRLGTFFTNNNVKVLGVKKVGGTFWYQIDGGAYPGAYINSVFVSAMAQPTPPKDLTIPADVKTDDYWVDVDISKKILTLYKFDQVVMATYIAVGNRETPTILGNYNVWLKVKKTRMRGAPPLATHVYDLPDVPWTMFYQGSYSVHGTYWHDEFGSSRSAGCTNVTQGDAKFIFDLTGPDMGNLDSVRSTADNPGMAVYNHY